MTSSLYDATSAIDELTRSLADSSRVSTPEEPSALRCCCGRDECEHTQAWRALKAKLESRLVLSAEIGQALLQKHEAYVRRMQVWCFNIPLGDSEASQDNAEDADNMEARVVALTKENAALEKRTQQALLNNEIAESSTKAALQDLQEAQNTIARLTAEHARSVGWEARLRSAMQERDDFQQERDNSSQRARMAEARMMALNTKCSKLRQQVRVLQDDLEQQRMSRSVLSEDIMREARVRIEELHRTHFGRRPENSDVDVSKIIEPVITDNEALKKENAELQRLLADARDNLHTLQEDAEEHHGLARSAFADGELHAPVVSSGFIKILADDSSRFLYGTAPGPVSPISSEFALREGRRLPRRSSSSEPRFQLAQEPMTPETTRRPISPPDSTAPSSRRGRAGPNRLFPPLRLDHDVEPDLEDDSEPLSPIDKSHGLRTLMLLIQHKSVQTDPMSGVFLPIPSGSGDPFSSTASPHDGRSETSSLTENPSTLTILMERVAQLFSRMSQADALTLTNRLKRQRLLGADVSHLSRSTVETIISELATLRAHFRTILEDEKIVTTCTRKDLRALFKLFRDMFQELGSLRITLNDVVLNPSIAQRVREQALNPTKAESSANEQETKAASSGPAGWIAPLSKLFGASSEPKQTPGRSNTRSTSIARPQPRLAPKIAPATSASTTMVNVEFSGVGTSRAVTNTFTPATATAARSATTPSRNVSQSTHGSMIPKAPNKLLGQPANRQLGIATLGRSAGRSASTSGHGRGVSRNVDAIIDIQSPIVEEGGDFNHTLLERTLRPRGLSDSSIHTTFMNHGEEAAERERREAEQQAQRGQSVLQLFSQKVVGIRSAAAHGHSSPAGALAASPTTSHFAGSNDAHREQGSGPAGADILPRTTSPRLADFLPDLTSWAGMGQSLESPEAEALFVGSTRPEHSLHRAWGRESHGRDI
ncbi:hypothetical protein EVG20_g6548 [Dentipellis fragilis]|uniref:Uncharacterized protein n=1 Tax=Dentipellis fragilis TaxID=205917 RepID=A0A4Y9YJX5_9AGAM|nr:hypothetical protein EVG20_g6548 [Dentipellis fragilis]